MTDYFFISSPLHLMMAANLAIQNPRHESLAVVISKTPDAGRRLRAAAEAVPTLFMRVLDVSGAPLRFGRARPSRFQQLKTEFARPMSARLFTGNDRRMEFQYAMHVATRVNPKVEGFYLDEGAVTYMGHKSMHRLSHRYIDPFFKRICYGRWYAPARTTGTSAWIRAAYVAFPDAVHPRLREKRIVAIEPGPFMTDAFRTLARAMLGPGHDIAEKLRGVRWVLTLPHEGSYIRRPEKYRPIREALYERFAPAVVAIKPHPRITRPELIDEMFPGATRLDHAVGMEALLPLLPENGTVAGDISTTLLTTRWLRPDLRVLAFRGPEGPPEALAALFAILKIPVLAPSDIRASLLS